MYKQGPRKRGAGGRALAPPHFWKEIKCFSIALENVLTMVNS